MKLYGFLVAAATFSAVMAASDGRTSFGTAFQDLAKDDQVEFVRAVNKSMEDYKASTPEKRLFTIYAVNRDAVKAAPEKERKAVIAEVFATAPMDALPMITDRFASELFSRKAAGFSDKDDSFVEFASATLMRIRNRLFSGVPIEKFPGARSAFAVICFLKASEGNPEDLRQSLLFYVLTGSQELARKVWIPAALGEDGKAPSYQPILEAGYKGEEPPHVNLHPMAPIELGNLQVGSDLRVENAKDVSSPKPLEAANGLNAGGGLGQGVNRTPRAAAGDPDSPWYRRRRGDQPDDEPESYMGQGL